MIWTEIKISVPAGDVEATSAIANVVADHGIYIEDYSNLEADVERIAHINIIDADLLAKDRSMAVVHVYISPEEQPAERVAFLKERLGSERIKHTITLTDCKNADWENNWKKHFHPQKLGNRLLIQPEWIPLNEEDARGRAVLFIEPGLAFGTGTHETTRLCLLSLEKYLNKNDEVLDIGTGSGILAIASVLLGAKRAVGVDNDKLAVKTAKGNGVRNNLDDESLMIIEGNLASKVEGTYDVVVANIVASAIMELSAQVQSFMRPNGYFISSGIIDTREDETKQALLKSGFTIVKRTTQNGWVCFVCRA